jgi:serine/threonine protein phosphatase PrpC
MKFTIAQDSRVGGRRNNQDRVAYSYSREALLMVVADGMGGHLHGEVAAQIAVQYLTETFQRESRPRLPDPFLYLSWGLTNAHHAIVDYAAEHGLPEAPRTTCVACVIQDSIAYWAHAGDSRLYVLRGERVLAQTRDHSRVQMMVDQGLIDEEEAKTHPERNRVYSCLGGAGTPQIEFSRKTPLNAGDVVGLCTDGVWGPLGDDLPRLLGGGVTAAVPRLLDEAQARGGSSGDNLSLIAIDWEENYGETKLPAGIETSTMPLDTHTTLLMNFDAPRPREAELSEEDIERAIEEIRGAIRKHSR